MDSKYIAALETECEQANTLIGLLRHAAAAAKHPWYSYTYPPYVAYREARATRYTLWREELALARGTDQRYDGRTD